MTVELDTSEPIQGDRLLGFGRGDHAGLQPEDVVVRQVASSGWRVYDSRMPERDQHSVLGFIERRDDRFEVMQLGSGFQWFVYETLDEAVDHLSDPERFGSVDGRP